MKAALKPFYGHVWRHETRPRILARAAYECERCAAPDRPMNARVSSLEVAHLNADPKPAEEEDDTNLACFCHTCHRRHDYDAWAAQYRDWLARRRDELIDARDAARPILQMLKEAS